MLNRTFFRWTGFATLIGGLLIALSLIAHPSDLVANVTTRSWALSHAESTLGFLLLMFGLMGVYLAQYQESGRLGALGFVLTFISSALMFALSYYEAFFAPVEAAMDPTFSKALFSRQLPEGLMAVLYVSFLLTILGWLVMAIATTRSRILPPMPLWMAFFGSLVLLADEEILPFGHWPGAILGLAIAWLGYYLLRHYRTNAIGAANNSMESTRPARCFGFHAILPWGWPGGSNRCR